MNKKDDSYRKATEWYYGLNLEMSKNKEEYDIKLSKVLKDLKKDIDICTKECNRDEISDVLDKAVELQKKVLDSPFKPRMKDISGPIPSDSEGWQMNRKIGRMYSKLLKRDLELMKLEKK